MPVRISVRPAGPLWRERPKDSVRRTNRYRTEFSCAAAIHRTQKFPCRKFVDVKYKCKPARYSKLRFIELALIKRGIPLSGRKNHHVPQLLQRDFGIRKAKSVQVWVYRREETPFLTSTANFGAERDFYIEGEDRSVDDLITDFENEHESLIKSARNGDQRPLEDRLIITSILAHLEMRSKFLRLELTFIPERFFGELRYHLSKPQNMLHYLRTTVANNPDVVQSGINDSGLNDEQRRLVNAYLDANLERFLEDTSGKLIDQFLPSIGLLIHRLADVVKKKPPTSSAAGCA